MHKTLIAAALTALTPALAFAADEVTSVTYGCKDNKTLQVVYVNTDASSFAIISQMDEMIPMTQVVTASGASYEAINPHYTYRLDTKGQTASLSIKPDGKEEVLFADCQG